MSTTVKTFADEDLISQCIEIIRSEGRASISLFQRRLRTGYSRTRALMDELANRKIVERHPNPKNQEHKILIPIEEPPTVQSAAPKLSLTPRSAFLAANPDKKRLAEEQVGKAMRHVSGFLAQTKDAGENLVNGAENARLAGVYFIEYIESLPGKKLTLDLYRQDKHLFESNPGVFLTMEQILWFVRTAQRRNEPFKLVGDVVGIYKEMLLAGGQIDEVARAQQTAHVPLEPQERIKEYFGADILDTISKLRQNPHYCPDGHLRPDLRATLAEDLKPKLPVWDSAREWVRQEIGV